MVTKSQKLGLVQAILDQKELLFGQLTNSITRNAEFQAWTRIREELLSIGGCLEDIKNAAIIRDKIWPNLKNTAFAKHKKRKNTRVKGGNICEVKE
jgi:Myb/SANT-like DNA-binding domain